MYTAINKYYNNYSAIPSFDELDVIVRELPVSKTLATLRLLDNTDISAEIALDALIDQYTQNECIKLLDKFVDKLPVYDSEEIKENLSTILMTLDEKTITSENVYSMSDICVFQRPEELSRSKTYLGINNSFDSEVGGVARQELILVGGERGSGKSVVCSNLMVNQYEAGNTSVYFTIEMIAQETLHRNIAILAGVNHQNVKKGTLTDDEILRIVKARANMYTNGSDLVDDFLKHRDRYRFEETLNKVGTLKEDNQMIIIDDRALKLGAIDLHLGKTKAKFGDKFVLAIIDYMNQIVVEGVSQFDWQPQLIISKRLKELARKHDIVILSPYQIDKLGEARFSKGILDAADIALVMEAQEESLSFKTTKIRGAREMSFCSGIHWDSLKISPIPISKPEPKEKIAKAGKPTEKEDTNKEKAYEDVPWN